MSEKILSVRDLTVINASNPNLPPILDKMSFDVAPKETVSIIGRSGAGKSVLARTLIGWVDAPLATTGGSVLFEGEDVLTAKADALKKLRGSGIGYVGADPTRVFDPTISVGDQIAEKLQALKPEISRKEALERVFQLFELVRIPEAKHRMAELPSKYSGGMIQRAAIVDAMIGETKLLIADNVTQPLDVTVAAQIIRLFEDLRERLGTAFVFVSSSVPVVKDFADRLIVMEKGEIVEEGKTLDIIANPATPYSTQLISQAPKIWVKQEERPQADDKVANKEATLSIRSVSKTYKVPRKDRLFGSVNVQAVRGIDLEIFPGESIAIVGESGCGKSTLMRLLTWLEAPDEGQVQFRGKDIGGLSKQQRFELRAQLQLVLQDPYGSIPAHWTIGRTISESIKLHRSTTRREQRAIVEDAMKEVGLDPALFDKLPTGLSAGQRQRINVARALVLEPSVLLLDETLSALAPMEQGPLIQLFEHLQQTRAITCIFISHDLALVRRVASRVAVMYLGRIVEVGTNEQIFGAPKHPYTRALLSAAPTLEESPYNADESLVDGEPPSPIHLPVGCAFADRCPAVKPRCRQEDPSLRSDNDKAGVACLFPLTA